MQPEQWLEIKNMLEELEDLPEDIREVRLAGYRDRHPDQADMLARLLDADAPPTRDFRDALREPARTPGFGDLSGRRLGAWRLCRPLGNGGMGSVWLAEREDPRLMMRAAVKLLHGSIASGELVDRFFRERQLLADLRHPHICVLYDGGLTEENLPYLVMEYIDGRTIDAWCAEQVCPGDEVLRLLSRVADALAYAHRQGVVHRDVKPANIMVTADGFVKLMDFGIARHEDWGDGLTLPGRPPCTPEYAAPEQLRGEGAGPSCDVYALGLVLVRLLSGRHPRTLSGQYTRALEATTLPGLLDLVESMTAPNAAMRPTAREASLLLGEMAAQLSQAEPGGPEVAVCRRGDGDDVPARALTARLRRKGYRVYLAGECGKSLAGINAALTRCDVLLLLLSRAAAASEMVQETLARVRERHEREQGRPLLIPVMVEAVRAPALDPSGRALLQGYAHGQWEGPADTQRLADEVAAVIAGTDPESLGWRKPGEATRAAGGGAEDARADLPGGTVPLHSAFYVPRSPAEEACYEAIEQPGALIRIKAPRQMGKTSLMTRVLAHAAGRGLPGVQVNLQMAEARILGDLNAFLRWLCAVIGRRLKHDGSAVADCWDDIFGAKDNCTAYFEEELLANREALVLALDDVDRLFDFPETAEEVLGLLRVWHEMGKTDPVWQKLRLVVVHATEVYIPMHINRSPFNVGLSAALPELSDAQVAGLVTQHGLDDAAAEAAALMALVGGHPHLIRLALYHRARGVSLSEVLDQAATDRGLFADHLKRLLWHLEQHPELAEAARTVMAADGPVRLPTESAFKLVSLGLVRWQGDKVCPARDLYRRYFQPPV